MDLEQIKAAMTEGLKDFGEKVKGMIDGALAPIKDEQTKQADRLAKIEALPAIAGKQVNVNTIPTEYKGYNLEEQGLKIAEKVGEKKTYGAFSNPEKFNKYKMWMIDLKKALYNKDLESISLLQKAAMAEGAGSTGGYLVPVDYEMAMIRLAREASFALQYCTVIPMAHQTMLLPSEATLVSVNWIGEASSITASDPTYGQVNLTAKKLAGLTTAVSNELLADSEFDIVSLLTEQFAYATVLELDNQVLNGTGSPVSGVLSAAAGYSVVLGTGLTNFSSVTASDFRNLMRKLSNVDSANGKFVYSKDIQYYVDTLKDTTGQFIYRQPSADKPAKLWSRDVFEASNAPLEAASATGVSFAAFGDWKQFYIGQRKGQMTIDVDPYSSFATDGTRFRMVTRWALAMARATAFARMKTA